jgi:hypothetical protein
MLADGWTIGPWAPAGAFVTDVVVAPPDTLPVVSLLKTA